MSTNRLETCACLWEAMLEVKAESEINYKYVPIKHRDLCDAVSIWFRTKGFAEVRTTVVSWTDELQQSWDSEDRSNYSDSFDRDFVPEWLYNKLIDYLAVDISDPKITISQEDLRRVRTKVYNMLLDDKHNYGMTSIMTNILTRAILVLHEYVDNKGLAPEYLKIRETLLNHGMTGPRMGLNKEVGDLLLEIYVMLGGDYFEKMKKEGIINED